MRACPQVGLERFVMCILSVGQDLITNGRAIKTMPTRIIMSTLETKYGKAHKATPARRAMPCRCLFPYTRYAMPNEPNNKPHIILAELSMVVSSLFPFSYLTHNVRNQPTKEVGWIFLLDRLFPRTQVASVRLDKEERQTPRRMDSQG